ncbi:hypothetical protein Cni_G20538 [Canna indica]|uniref:Uncharacterized protein n=1 Tax=Canna indica TaxID=4628 RepID=A0AAQ3QHV5_9LILI|nr:hypothetical protein Cni_G20538 [Canna indica]
MASEDTINRIYGQCTGYDGDDDLENEPRVAATPSVYFASDVVSCYNAAEEMSRLSLEFEGDDADAEPSEEDEELKNAGDEGGGGGGALMEYGTLSVTTGVTSMPGTPARGPAEWLKEYASETEARGRGVRRRQQRRRRQARERWLERAWQMKKSHAAEEDVAAAAEELRVVVRPRCGCGCGSGRMCMDMEEVRACRDLGLGLPSEWTVEIPETFSDLTADTSSGGNSPIHWRISSPGDDPRDVKARLKVWAQAVALTSAASRLSG